MSMDPEEVNVFLNAFVFFLINSTPLLFVIIDKSAVSLYMFIFTATSCCVLLRLKSHSPGSISV